MHASQLCLVDGIGGGYYPSSKANAARLRDSAAFESTPTAMIDYLFVLFVLFFFFFFDFCLLVSD